jgi:glyoxylase-like metal-dependent hydrolase (beta-lactamase superfamily II)
MNSDPIRRVSVVSTGTVEIRPEHVGPTWKPLYLWLLTSQRWTPPRPINAYVIEHRDGLILFDTGQDRASVTDPNYFPAGLPGLIYDRLARFGIGPDETLTARLRALGYGIDDVSTAVLSHLHQDHIGGLPELRHANVITSRSEWQTILRPLPEPRGFLRSHIDLPGLRWQHLEPEPMTDADLGPFTTGHDLFGDGSIVLLPTPGHTPGSLSMLIRRPGRAPLLMVGDLTYDARLLAEGKVPGAGDRKQMRGTVAMVNALRRRHPDLTILAAHDPHAANLLAAAQDPATQNPATRSRPVARP